MALLTSGFVLSDNDSYPNEGEYIELKDSGALKFVPDNADALREFIVCWSDLVDFANALIGWAKLVNEGDSGTIQRELPDQHSLLPLLYCTECSSVGWGPPSRDAGNNNIIAFPYAKVSATYKYLPYLVRADNDPNVTSELDRFVTRTYTYQGQYLSIDGNFLSNTADSNGKQTLMKAGPGKIIGTIEKTLTWNRVPANSLSGADDPAFYNVPNYQTIKACLGCVNSTTFDGDPPGSVLFVGVDPHLRAPSVADGDPTALTSSDLSWDIVMKFIVVDNGDALVGDTVDAVAGHNYVYNVYLSPGAWDLYTAGIAGVAGTLSGTRIYEHEDLNTLFLITV